LHNRISAPNHGFWRIREGKLVIRVSGTKHLQKVFLADHVIARFLLNTSFAPRIIVSRSLSNPGAKRGLVLFNFIMTKYISEEKLT
jgi:hypothetical protein